MKERAILFSGPMVRAILDGRKTQTRRVVKPQPHEDFDHIEVGPYHPTRVDRHGEEYPGSELFGAFTHEGECAWKSPYGQPGDRLWVRETLSATHTGLEYAADNTAVNHDEADEFNDRYARFQPFELEPRSIPSIFMPRWASRILLEVTDVRVERLQDISDEDATAEGVEAYADQQWKECKDIAEYGFDLEAGDWFELLWSEINGRDSWDSNPWVWAITFKLIEEKA